MQGRGSDTASRDTDSNQPLPAQARPLPARRSGYVQTISHEGALQFATDQGLVIWYRRTVGEQVTAGTVIAWAWRPDGQPLDDNDEITQVVNDAVRLSGERTVEEDVAFGIRQLVDIAIRALSPSLNDPTTAVDALGRLSVLLCALVRNDLGAQVHTDADDVTRIGIPHPTFAHYLDLACTQIANYAAADIAAVLGLFKLLGEVGEVTTDPVRKKAVAHQIDTALRRAEDQLSIDSDRQAARNAARAAREALQGKVNNTVHFTL